MRIPLDKKQFFGFCFTIYVSIQILKIKFSLYLKAKWRFQLVESARKSIVSKGENYFVFYWNKPVVFLLEQTNCFFYWNKPVVFFYWNKPVVFFLEQISITCLQYLLWKFLGNKVSKSKQENILSMNEINKIYLQFDQNQCTFYS